MSLAKPFLYHLEWPAPSTTVRGPVVWLRGWAVGREGNDFMDIRVRHGTHTHLGMFGFPRIDLAKHFQSERAWLPAEFVVGVRLSDGSAILVLEAQDAEGIWHHLQALNLVVAPDGAENPSTEGKLTVRAGGSWTLRGAHAPFRGHLDEPSEPPASHCGRTPIFGWLFHESQPITAILATTDLLVFNQVSHGLTDDLLAQKLALPEARQARLKGEVDLPSDLKAPACLRVYAQLADGTMHLCFVQRLLAPREPAAMVAPAAPASVLPAITPATMPELRSGRPRRLLLCTCNLRPEDATLRALDIGRHLIATGRWAIRLVTTVEGPLRASFEAAGIDVQLVNPQPVFAARDPAEFATALAHLARQIWWQHLDAVAVFDLECFWAITHARRLQLPVLFDCSVNEALVPPDGIPPDVAAALRTGWSSANYVCWASPAGAQCNADLFSTSALAVVPHWTNVSANTARQPFVVAPIDGLPVHGAAQLLRAGDWLARRHPDFPWSLAVTHLTGDDAEQCFIQDAAFNRPAIMAIESIPVIAAAACVCPAFSGHPIRALLDAAAAGVPIITTYSPAVETIFSAAEATFVPAGHFRALAQALANLAADPEATVRRSERARLHVRTHHAAPILLARWQSVLETMVAVENETARACTPRVTAP